MGSGRGVKEASASSIRIYLFLKDLKQCGKMIGFHEAELRHSGRCYVSLDLSMLEISN